MTDEAAPGTDEASPDNVLRPVFGSQSDVVGERRHCQHRQRVVNAETREVTCGGCGRLLDPFQVLLEYANKERRWRDWDRERTEQETRLAELKAEERRVKLRTAAASRKDATVAVDHERQTTFVRRQAIAEKAKDVAELARQIVRLVRVETDVSLGAARRVRREGK